MGGPCSTPEGKRPLGRPRRRWVDNIRLDIGAVGWDDVNWIGLAQDRNRWRALLNLRVPWNSGKLSSGLTSSGLSSSAQLHRQNLLLIALLLFLTEKLLRKPLAVAAGALHYVQRACIRTVTSNIRTASLVTSETATTLFVQYSIKFNIETGSNIQRYSYAFISLSDLFYKVK
jgi:hypothetical protein